MSMQHYINRGGYRYGVHIRNHLITADRGHQKVQKQDVITSVADPLDGSVGIVFHIHQIAGTLEISLDR